MEHKKNENVLNIQRIVIVLLSVFLLMTIVSGVTFAWYKRYISDMLGITLSHPVEIYLREDMGVPQGSQIVIPVDEAKILPGTKINLKLGFVLGKEDKISSPAYVRIKLKITSDAYVDQGGSIIDEGLVDFGEGRDKPTPVSTDWIEADFGPEDGGKWWVFSQNVNLNEGTDKAADYKVVAREAYDKKNAPEGVEIPEQYLFYQGQMRISTKLTNIFANKSIKIEYIVSAIQTMNVENPLKNLDKPTWGTLIEDEEESA